MATIVEIRRPIQRDFTIQCVPALLQHQVNQLVQLGNQGLDCNKSTEWQREDSYGRITEFCDGRYNGVFKIVSAYPLDYQIGTTVYIIKLDVDYYSV